MTRACSTKCGKELRHPDAVPISKTLRHKIKNASRREGILKDDKPYTIQEIAERDGYRCGLCHRGVDMSLSGLHGRGPTIDHILPFAASRRLGEPPDDRRINVQLAHRSCNQSKFDRSDNVQQLLFG